MLLDLWNGGYRLLLFSWFEADRGLADEVTVEAL